MNLYNKKKAEIQVQDLDNNSLVTDEHKGEKISEPPIEDAEANLMAVLQ